MTPDVQKAVRLVDYLTKLARLRTRPIRNLDDYQNVLWLSSVSRERGCFTRAWGQDEEHEPDEWLEVQNRRKPELPSVPAQCHDWLNQSTVRKKSDLPELLPEIIREVQNPDWREGSTKNHPEELDLVIHCFRREPFCLLISKARDMFAGNFCQIGVSSVAQEGEELICCVSIEHES